MNRLIIIGNGFDLAHGLPTSYRDFIDDYWAGIKDSEYNDDFISFECKSKVEFGDVKNLKDLSKFFIDINQDVKFSDAEIYTVSGNDYLTGKFKRNHILKYENRFFGLINKKCIQNWVDIENEYYKELKKIVALKPNNSLIDSDEFEISRNNKILKLNLEFDQVKRSLENYLDKISITKERDGSISNLFRIHNGSDEYFLEFPNQDLEELKDFYKKYNPEKRRELVTYCLNFNYTTTIDKYIDLTRQFGEDRTYGQFENLQIHGRLKDVNNKVNFGFGDEMDDDYRVIENLDDNEYLKNFKSFQYLQNSNYKKLLDFIDGEKFQVFIMGHSCGLSDRTLLNTIFEHNNCRSIKVFYHKRNDGTDNYTEIIQNISRHFNKKKLMREKIVNKTLCQPLPQVQLSKKQNG